ncbi:hypothetical protein PMAA_078270 [Talaromyces marneffei ATCC 18224]|uniref:Uncharacterized protein n=1 Tax=Talaromyces marneffei (strain ATCC 18224 / CBS 334.59 / QM 7333) TaxID=441960 RepID=B6QDL2_TALMQ|nr:hypothetical protein PMAA_078270 [Talaromyces marneffei ATCC 18224]
MSSQKESIPFLSQGQNLKLERPHVEKAIENLHKTLSEMLVILLNDQNIVNLPIRAYDLDLPGQNNESSDSKQLSFFQPMSEEDYFRYKLSEKDKERHLKSKALVPSQGGFGKSKNLFISMNQPDLENFATYMNAGASVIQESTRTMMVPLATTLKIVVKRNHCAYKRATGSDVRERTQKKKTHFMLALELDCENQEELLSVEVLEILAVMKATLGQRRISEVVCKILIGNQDKRSEKTGVVLSRRSWILRHFNGDIGNIVFTDQI